MKSFAQYLTESTSFDNWVVPDGESLRLEYQVEYEMKSLKNSGYWPTFSDFFASVQAGKVRSVDQALDDKIGNRSYTDSYESLLALIKSYRSYPEFRNEKTLKGLYEAFKTGKEMKMPMIIDNNGKYRIFSGNTRMDVANQLGITPKALFIKPKATS